MNRRETHTTPDGREPIMTGTDNLAQVGADLAMIHDAAAALPPTDLQILRVSVARIAQALNVQTFMLPVLDKSYPELLDLARTVNRGWNQLAGECVGAARTCVERP